MENIISFSDFLSKRPETGKSWLLLYKSDSELSLCAYRNLENAFEGQPEINIYAADVSRAEDIHSNYGISSVPSLLIFNEDNLTGIIKGCHDSGYYRALAENAIYQPEKAQDGKSARQVTVYSTPTCSWCNTLKAWLQKNNIRYTDIDVSRDEHAAEELVKRSGQQGVPQTDINGQIVVGFNQPRLQQLLGI